MRSSCSAYSAQPDLDSLVCWIVVSFFQSQACRWVCLQEEAVVSSARRVLTTARDNFCYCHVTIRWDIFIDKGMLSLPNFLYNFLKLSRTNITYTSTSVSWFCSLISVSPILLATPPLCPTTRLENVWHAAPLVPAKSLRPDPGRPPPWTYLRTTYCTARTGTCWAGRADGRAAESAPPWQTLRYQKNALYLERRTLRATS